MVPGENEFDTPDLKFQFGCFFLISSVSLLKLLIFKNVSHTCLELLIKVFL